MTLLPIASNFDRRIPSLKRSIVANFIESLPTLAIALPELEAIARLAEIPPGFVSSPSKTT
jgi:hypothetical protein